MPPAVCRTCLAVLKENTHEFFTLENSTLGITTFREKLSCCIPELALDIIPNAVICRTCSKTLNLAYSFKTKCLETETKVREYVQSFNENFEAKVQWFAGFANKNVNPNLYFTENMSPITEQEQYSASKNYAGIKLEIESYDGHFNGDRSFMDTNGDLFTETSNNVEINAVLPFKINNFSENFDKSMADNGKLLNCKLDSNEHWQGNHEIEMPRIKLEYDMSEEFKFKDACFKNEAQEPRQYYNYFTKALQQLKANNMKRTSSAYQQAFEQFNLLKVIQSLANQGTEINIKDISQKNKILNEVAKQFTKMPEDLMVSDYDEKSPNSSKLKKPLYERYDCYYCDRSFDRLSLLKTHTISHTGVKPFVCNICGKGCSHKGELNNHLRTHTGEKPFKCSLCDASFSQISNMKIHMRTHTGEKPYKCDYCEKTFSHKCGVKVHMRTHTGERPYKCEICLKTYTHKKDLDDHMRTHTGEKYRCTICLKEITYKKNLSAHMITHSVKNSANLGVLKKITSDYPQRIT